MIKRRVHRREVAEDLVVKKTEALVDELGVEKIGAGVLGHDQPEEEQGLDDLVSDPSTEYTSCEGRYPDMKKNMRSRRLISR